MGVGHEWSVPTKAALFQARPRAPADRTYRPLTTITDPLAAPASDLARLYYQRWELKTASAELTNVAPGWSCDPRFPMG